MESDEQYLGGFNSTKLARGRFRGYGVHATTKRVFGSKSRRGALAGALLGGGLLGQAIGGALTGQVKAGESAQMIKELEEKKDFEINKEQISEIQMRKPNRWRFRTGQMLVVPKLKGSDGAELKVSILGKNEYQRLWDLMSRFYAEATKAVG